MRLQGKQIKCLTFRYKKIKAFTIHVGISDAYFSILPLLIFDEFYLYHALQMYSSLDFLFPL